MKNLAQKMHSIDFQIEKKIKHEVFKNLKLKTDTKLAFYIIHELYDEVIQFNSVVMEEKKFLTLFYNMSEVVFVKWA